MVNNLINQRSGCVNPCHESFDKGFARSAPKNTLYDELFRVKLYVGIDIPDQKIDYEVFDFLKLFSGAFFVHGEEGQKNATLFAQ
jgi:hypothetical protein